MGIKINELAFHWCWKWSSRPNQWEWGKTVPEYCNLFSIWKEQMVSISFPVDEGDYIDGFIENLSENIRLRLSKSRHRRNWSRLSDAFNAAKFEESMTLLEVAIKQFEAHMVFDKMPSQLSGINFQQEELEDSVCNNERSYDVNEQENDDVATPLKADTGITVTTKSFDERWKHVQWDEMKIQEHRTTLEAIHDLLAQWSTQLSSQMTHTVAANYCTPSVYYPIEDPCQNKINSVEGELESNSLVHSPVGITYEKGVDSPSDPENETPKRFHRSTESVRMDSQTIPEKCDSFSAIGEVEFSSMETGIQLMEKPAELYPLKLDVPKVSYQVLEEMPEPVPTIQHSSSLGSLFHNKAEKQWVDRMGQPSSLKMGGLKVVRHLFDEMTEPVPKIQQSFSLVSLLINEGKDDSLLNKVGNYLLEEMEQPFWVKMRSISEMQKLFFVEPNEDTDGDKGSIPPIYCVQRVFDSGSDATANVCTNGSRLKDDDIVFSKIPTFIFDPGGRRQFALKMIWEFKLQRFRFNAMGVQAYIAQFGHELHFFDNGNFSLIDVVSYDPVTTCKSEHSSMMGVGISRRVIEQHLISCKLRLPWVDQACCWRPFGDFMIRFGVHKAMEYCSCVVFRPEIKAGLFLLYNANRNVLHASNISFDFSLASIASSQMGCELMMHNSEKVYHGMRVNPTFTRVKTSCCSLHYHESIILKGHEIVVLVRAMILENFVWHPGLCAISPFVVICEKIILSTFLLFPFDPGESKKFARLLRIQPGHLNFQQSHFLNMLITY